MRLLILTVNGGNTHSILYDRLAALQELVAALGAESCPQFLRIGSIRNASFQPVGARAFLREIEFFAPRLSGFLIPGFRMVGPDGSELGAIYPNGDGAPAGAKASLSLWAASGGIRLVSSALPPPVGFRAHPGLLPGEHECYFTRLERTADGWRGYRAPGMGGSGAPVSLPPVPIPPPTRWDVSVTAGKPEIGGLTYVETPAPEVFAGIIHAFESACLESLRLKEPLSLRVE